MWNVIYDTISKYLKRGDIIVVILFLDIFTEKRQLRERAYQSSYVSNTAGSFLVRENTPETRCDSYILIYTGRNEHDQQV